MREGLLTEFQAEKLLNGKGNCLLIGKYKVLDHLGTGAMGTVYLCEHPQMRRLVAVKVLRPGIVSPRLVKKRWSVMDSCIIVAT